MEKLATINQIQVLQFVIENAHICIDLRFVNKILPLMQLERVPNCPNYFAGLMNLEGKTIPVIDLAIRLGMQRINKYSLDMPILLCTYENHQAGMLVDNITNLSLIQENTIQMHEEFDTTDSPFLGSVSINENLSLLLNLSHIFPISTNLETVNPLEKGIMKKHRNFIDKNDHA